MMANVMIQPCTPLLRLDNLESVMFYITRGRITWDEQLNVWRYGWDDEKMGLRKRWKKQKNSTKLRSLDEAL